MRCSRCGFVKENSFNSRRFIAEICPKNNFMLCSYCLELTTLVWERIDTLSKTDGWGQPRCIDGKLIILFSELQKILDEPVYIHKAYEEEGHVENSFHYSGQAIDFHVGTQPVHSLLKVWKILNEWWNGGLGVYPCWNEPGFHIDMGPKKRWQKNKEGVYTCMLKSSFLQAA